jgi:hypothetical protein
VYYCWKLSEVLFEVVDTGNLRRGRAKVDVGNIGSRQGYSVIQREMRCGGGGGYL